MKNITKIKYSLALVLFSVTLQAQESFPDDTQDVPVDNWLIPMAILGIALMYFFIKKKRPSLV
jgi:hypothetical protein